MLYLVGIVLAGFINLWFFHFRDFFEALLFGLFLSAILDFAIRRRVDRQIQLAIKALEAQCLEGLQTELQLLKERVTALQAAPQKRDAVADSTLAKPLDAGTTMVSSQFNSGVPQEIRAFDSQLTAREQKERPSNIRTGAEADVASSANAHANAHVDPSTSDSGIKAKQFNQGIKSAAAPSASLTTSSGAQSAQDSTIDATIESGVVTTLSAIKNWFTGGNTIVRVGIVMLFIGLVFLARYSIAAGLFPVELRLAIIAAVSIALLVFGFKCRDSKPAFALPLQGAGVACLYLTIFAAFKLYDLIPAGFAFAAMIAVCALSCCLAV